MLIIVDEFPLGEAFTIRALQIITTSGYASENAMRAEHNAIV